MDKIRLALDGLQVESFEPAPRNGGPRGTVRAHVTAYWELCHPTQTADPDVATCGETENSCAVTCFEHTCYQCGPGPTAGCRTQDLRVAACTSTCGPIYP